MTLPHITFLQIHTFVTRNPQSHLLSTITLYTPRSCSFNCERSSREASFTQGSASCLAPTVKGKLHTFGSCCHHTCYTLCSVTLLCVEREIQYHCRCADSVPSIQITESVVFLRQLIGELMLSKTQFKRNVVVRNLQ